MNQVTSLTLSQVVERRSGGIYDDPPPGYVTNIDRALPTLDAMGGRVRRIHFACSFGENESGNPVLLQRAYLHSPPQHLESLHNSYNRCHLMRGIPRIDG